nr:MULTISPECIES: sugar-binding domain-containing protein [unclassified Enterococcus]
MFVPLVGTYRNLNGSPDANMLAYDIARTFMGKSITIPAHIFQETVKIKESVVHSAYFQSVNQLWADIDISLVEIGANLNQIVKKYNDALTTKDIEQLKLDKVVTEYCGLFLNRKGAILESALYDRKIAIQRSSMRKITDAIGVVQGKKAASSALSVLKSRLINTLITDKETAVEILKRDKDGAFDLSS